MAQDMQKGFLLYYDYRKHLALLNDEERRKLFMALLDYGEHNAQPELEGASLMAFSFIQAQMDRDAEKYAETVKKRSEAGKMGGRPSKAQKAKRTKKGDTVTETEIDIDHPLPPKVGQQQSVPFTQIVELYHAICTSYPKLRAIEGNRKKQIAARWKKYGGIEVFRELFERAEASAFLKGYNDNAWAADFDWLIRSTNMSKVLEGKYDNNRPKGEQGHGDNSGHSGGQNGDAGKRDETHLSGFQMADS